MKKFVLSLFVVMLLIGLATGCGKKTNEDAKKFKDEYESFNNKSNEYFEYRNLDIDEENPFIFATDEKIVKMIENKESFIVYFGDPQCPWCRSVIEEAIKSSKDNNIDKIYYVRFWGDFHEEKIRDVYELDEKNKPKLKQAGTESYLKLIEYLGNVLSEYTLKDKDGNTINVGEKRIFLPNFVKVEKGEAVKLIDGISKNQKEFNGELTEEIIKDEKDLFDQLFENTCSGNVC